MVPGAVKAARVVKALVSAPASFALQFVALLGGVLSWPLITGAVLCAQMNDDLIEWVKR